MKKVISLVPSITETLIECGVQVVGRTGYCLFPKDTVANIPIVGGTKNLLTKKFLEIEYDYVILDKEENTLSMYEKIGEKSIIIHIQSIADAANEFARFGHLLSNSKLMLIAEEYRKLNPQKRDLQSIPGIVRWWRRPTNEQRKRNLKYVYLIWDNPLMAVTGPTYIQSVFELFDLSNFNLLLNNEKSYPKIEPEQLDENAILLFSTEPYEFQIQKQKMMERFPNNPMALLDAEFYSWYGIRSLRKIQAAISDFKPF